MGIMEWPDSGAAILKGETYHARRGGPVNAFRYGVDYLLWRLEPETTARSPLLTRGRFGLLSLTDRDHGQGDAPMQDWAILQARSQGIPEDAMAEVWLLTQPRTLGYVFNPVSFWFFRDSAGNLRAVLAEVNNTFGDRHSYLCALPEWQPIGPADAIRAAKVFHVSPFQQVEGTYEFRFKLSADAVDIRIDHRRSEGETASKIHGSGHAGGGVVATLSGKVRPLSTSSLLGMIARYPLGALRVSALIHWQAVRLKLKGAPYRVRPAPPTEEVTR